MVPQRLFKIAPKTSISLSLNLILYLIFCSSFAAGESIRVAVRENIPSLSIRSKSVLLLKDTQGHLLYPGKTSSVYIEPAERGFRVNNTLIKTSIIRIVSPKENLEVGSQPLRGLIEVRRKGRNLTVINELDIEEYLKGVVPKEMAYDWHPEALKAQAVVARTYALYQKVYNAGREFDLVSTVEDQVYQGVGQERPETSQAVVQTDGLVVTYGGGLALTLYHSTSAGRTLDIKDVWDKDLPYLRGVDCPFDKESPYYKWQREIPLKHFEAALRKNHLLMGSLATLTPYIKSPEGRVKEIRILHSRGQLFLKGEEVRRVMGYSVLPSTLFDVVSIGRDIIMQGKGFGHGVGLCQWGTKVQAEHGKTFVDILKYYYTGIQIEDYRTLSLNQYEGPE